MANTTKYLVTTETGTEEFGNLSKVAAFLGVKKITKADLDADKYPMVSLAEVEQSSEEQYTLEDTGLINKVAEHLGDSNTEVEETVDTPTEAVEDTVDANKQRVLDLIAQAINDTPEDNEELFSALCDLEDAITDDLTPTEEQATLLTNILTGTPLTNTVEPEVEDVADDKAPGDIEYPEVGDFKDEKAMKKYVKGLSDASLEEWCILEGVEWKQCDHESINRMRMAMAIKAKHFPPAKGTGGKKSKSKYASYSTEDLVQIALDNDIEVPDDKGDMRICRMYTIMALRKAGLID